MATSTENIFRFMNIRPPERKKVKANMPIHNAEEDKTDFSRKLDAALSAPEGFPQEVKALAVEFRASSAYVDDLTQLPIDIEVITDLVEKTRDLPLNSIEFVHEFTTMLGMSPEAFLKSDEYRKARAALSDTILCDALLDRVKEKTVGAFKLLDLLRIAHDAHGLGLDVETPARILHNANVILPKLASLGKSAAASISPSNEIAKKIAAQREQTKELKRRIDQLREARQEMMLMAITGKYETEPEETAPRTTKAKTSTPGSHDKDSRTNVELIATKPQLASRMAKMALPRSDVDALSAGTKEALTQLKVDMEELQPHRAVSLIEHELSSLSARLAIQTKPRRLLRMHGITLDIDAYHDTFAMAESAAMGAAVAETGSDSADIEEIATDLRKLGYDVGVGDLLKVEQILKAYELSDFAHVENILAGEEHYRNHRRLNVREETVEFETEEETQSERDLQSTERNEMQTEAEKTVRSQFELDAGVHVTASFGSAVSLTSGLDVGFSNASEESKRKAETYAREVTERTTERVRERVREQEYRRVLEEIEEINGHKFVNTTGHHNRGIYRWLNKIYDAQIVNYGQRMMFEFIVPEPAAYYLYALTNNPLEEALITEPKPPEFGGAPLTPQHIDRSCSELVGLYGVSNAPICPSSFHKVSYFDSQDKTGDAGVTTYARAGKVEIPEQYMARGALVSCDYAAPEGYDPWAKIRIGGRYFNRVDSVGTSYQNLLSYFDGELAFTAFFANVSSFALAIDVYCDLTDAAYQAWQQEMYDAVMDAYTRQRLDYEAKMAARALQKGVDIQGKNPLENRQIEREELKKLVILMLQRQPIINILDSFYPHDEPMISAEDAAENGKQIRFFEHAFEWSNMLYVFYPYFWGRRPTWTAALNFTDPDPDFAAFLKAGAARVQVPVRPGFERSIAHYCQTGSIPEGNDIPVVEDDVFLPIIEEIIENMDGIAKGVPYPDGAEPWEVRVPTSLVLAQNLEEIPGIRDILTGHDVSIVEDA